MVSAHRQFVFANESIQRLPELTLLSGSILSFLTATALVAPTGFWDCRPWRTSGYFRCILIVKSFQQGYTGSPAPSGCSSAVPTVFKQEIGSIGKVQRFQNFLPAVLSCTVSRN